MTPIVTAAAAAAGLSGIGAVLAVLGALAGMLVIAAAAVAYFRASYARATIETLRDSNTALTARVQELETSEARLKTRCDSLEREAEHLRGYVSGTEAVRQLELKIDGYQEGLAEHRRTLVAELQGIRAALAGTAKAAGR